jgi:mannose-6-phosphate isomerase-like protein (cupin superfamily)
MALTFIDTLRQPRTRPVPGQGEVAQIVNRELCGAHNVLGMLRWLADRDRLQLDPVADSHQLVYLMEGAGIITLRSKDYAVKKGAGIYLDPGEAASIRPAPNASLKLFHLVVPRVKDR